jgi:predicted phosphodiesterase
MTRALYVLMAALAGIGTSCVRPAEDRAIADRHVGKGAAFGLDLKAENGLAAIRSMTEGSVSLWAGAPALRVTAQWNADAVGDWIFTVLNLVPGTSMEVQGGDCGFLTLRALEAPRETEIVYRAHVASGGTCTLSIAPADADHAGRYKFALLSDVQEAVDRVSDIFEDMNRRTDLAFVLGAGDLTEGGSSEQLERFQRELQALRLPYYATLGNHELGTTPPPWHDLFGRASFHFVYRKVHYSMIDSGSATVDPIVYGWLDEWLARASNSVHIVAMHIPPLDPVGVRNGAFANRNEAAKLLARLAGGNVDLTLYGHIHSYYRFDNAGIDAHISGGGGAIPERFDDVGRHYLVVTVDASTGIGARELVRID